MLLVNLDIPLKKRTAETNFFQTWELWSTKPNLKDQSQTGNVFEKPTFSVPYFHTAELDILGLKTRIHFMKFQS